MTRTLALLLPFVLVLSSPCEDLLAQGNGQGHAYGHRNGNNGNGNGNGPGRRGGPGGAPLPEPVTIALTALGASGVGLVLLRRRRPEVCADGSEV